LGKLSYDLQKLKLLMTFEKSFAPNITVRHLTNKGTSFINKPIKKENWMNEEFSKNERKRLKLAGDLMLMSSKGTTKIKLHEMQVSAPVCPKGYYISSEKGTCRRKLT
jgi:hypothetical protein